MHATKTDGQIEEFTLRTCLGGYAFVGGMLLRLLYKRPSIPGKDTHGRSH